MFKKKLNNKNNRKNKKQMKIKEKALLRLKNKKKI